MKSKNREYGPMAELVYAKDFPPSRHKKRVPKGKPLE